MKVRVFRITHPNDSPLQAIVLDALVKQDPKKFVDAFAASSQMSRELMIDASKAQFEVLKRTLISNEAFLMENANSADILEMLPRISPHIRNVFSQQQLPKSFSELTELQLMVLMTLPLYLIVPSINPSKLVCSTLLGSERENEIFFEHANNVIDNLENDAIAIQKAMEEIADQMNIMHAVSVCVATKSGMNTALVTGAMHDTKYLRCFIESPYGEFFYPSKQYHNDRGLPIPENEILSPKQCQENTALFLKEWPSYQRFISFCFNHTSEREAQAIKNEYIAACRLTQKQSSQNILKQDLKKRSVIESDTQNLEVSLQNTERLGTINSRKLISSAYKGVQLGALRGLGSVIKYRFDPKGLSKRVSLCAHAVVYGGTLALQYAAHYNAMTAQDMSETERMTTAFSQAVWDAGVLAFTETALDWSCQSADWIGKKAKENGWNRTSQALQWISDNGRYGSYAFQSYNQGPLSTLTSITTGIVAEKSVIASGKHLVDTFFKPAQENSKVSEGINHNIPSMLIM